MLEALGYRLRLRPDDNYQVQEIAGDVVIKDHYWVRLDDGVAGNAIDFFIKLQGKRFSEAMRLLCAIAAKSGWILSNV